MCLSEAGSRDRESGLRGQVWKGLGHTNERGGDCVARLCGFPRLWYLKYPRVVGSCVVGRRGAVSP